MKKLILAGLALYLVMGVGAGTAQAVTITWDAVTENTDGTECLDLAQYNIYVDGVFQGYVDAPTVEWGMTFPDGTYEAYVTAEDFSGNESGPSNIVTFTETSIPLAPQGCRVK